MFNLLPRKKHHENAQLRDYEPTRQSEGRSSDVNPNALSGLREEFDSLVSRVFDDRLRNRLSDFFRERGELGKWDMGWEDHPDQYSYHADLPGFDADEIDVNVAGNLLTVRAERKAEEKDEGGTASYRYRCFTKSLPLPQGGKADAIDAQYRSGVLRIVLPKQESTQRRRIDVKSQ